VAEEPDREQRTETATPRRRQEAREQGQVPLSSEMVAAVLLGGWTATLAAGGGALARSLGETLTSGLADLGALGTGDLGAAGAARALTALILPAGQAVLMLVVPLFALSLLAGYGQIGFVLSPKVLELDASKLDPIKGFKRIVSARSGVRTLLALLKILTICAVAAALAWGELDRVTTIAGSDLGPALRAVGHVALRCAGGAVAAILALALLDLVFQRFQHERELRMSRQELREELRSSEGDPLLRARIRRVQREMSSRRMMAEVPKATVVVTNPTHYAVALRYERGEGGEAAGAPRVVAKGVDFVAERIKELARESGVVCYEDVTLARALHARVEIGDEIPIDLYQAVASALAYVYRVQGLESPSPA
jgi:flagellar biosynthetic protein FlhB